MNSEYPVFSNKLAADYVEMINAKLDQLPVQIKKVIHTKRKDNHKF